MTDRDALLAFLRTLKIELNGEVTEDTPLLESGRIDSLGLLQLAMWVESELGRPLDPASFDLRKEWNTVNGIRRFLERHADG